MNVRDSPDGGTLIGPSDKVWRQPVDTVIAPKGLLAGHALGVEGTIVVKRYGGEQVVI